MRPVGNPKVLLFDEPTAALDPPTAATKILLLREGRVIFSGTNEEFVQSEDLFIRKFISGTEMEPVQTDLAKRES